MMRKKMLSIGLGVLLTLSATTILGNGLTLTSSGIASSIKVSCNGKSLPYEMKPDSSIKDIAWWVIYMPFQSNTLQCHFMLDNAQQTKIGFAEVDLNVLGGKAQVQHVAYDPAYHITVLPAENAYFSSLSVRISS